MIIIVVDANVLVSDPYMRKPEWSQLKEAVANRDAQVVAPLIVLEEVAGHQAAKLRSMGNLLTKAVDHGAPPELHDQMVSARADCQKRAQEYPDLMNQMWKAHSFRVAATPNVPHETVARRAIQRMRPFSASGDGYRDTLHWFTLLDLAKKWPTTEVVLLSNDKAFAGKDGTLHPGLRDEFACESSGRVTLCKDLRDLDVPARYSGPAKPAPEFEFELADMIVEYLLNEYPIHQVPGPRLGFADPDWMALAAVENVQLTSLTSRALSGRPELELRFRADAELTIEATYLSDVDLDDPIADEAVLFVPVQIVGIAFTRADELGIEAISELDAERHIGAKLQQVMDTVMAEGSEERLALIDWLKQRDAQV
jgi:hypothetical protein